MLFRSTNTGWVQYSWYALRFINRVVKHDEETDTEYTYLASEISFLNAAQATAYPCEIVSNGGTLELKAREDGASEGGGSLTSGEGITRMHNNYYYVYEPIPNSGLDFQGMTATLEITGKDADNKDVTITKPLEVNESTVFFPRKLTHEGVDYHMRTLPDKIGTIVTGIKAKITIKPVFVSSQQSEGLSVSVDRRVLDMEDYNEYSLKIINNGSVSISSLKATLHCPGTTIFVDPATSLAPGASTDIIFGADSTAALGEYVGSLVGAAKTARQSGV